mmetsp:Transcript_154327/g.287787  ORF Transcript_154327/g.287787 Transcript_154327/m.287787 type:complete len:256 (+) Transcript_154327:56-823(+)
MSDVDYSSPGPCVSDREALFSSATNSASDKRTEVDSSSDLPGAENESRIGMLMIPDISLRVLLTEKLEVVDMSKVGASFFSPLKDGDSFCDRLKESDVIGAWLRLVSDAVIDGRVPLPSVIKYGPAEVRGGESCWFGACLEVLFPKMYTPASPITEFSFKQPDMKSMISWKRQRLGKHKNKVSRHRNKASDLESIASQGRRPGECESITSRGAASSAADADPRMVSDSARQSHDCLPAALSSHPSSNPPAQVIDA